MRTFLSAFFLFFATQTIAQTGIVPSVLNKITEIAAPFEVKEGIAEDVSAFESVTVNADLFTVGASGTLVFEFSNDGHVWPSITSTSYTINYPGLLPQPQRILRKFFRTRYINGALSTDIDVHVVYHYQGSMFLSRLLTQAMDANEPVQTVRAVLSAQVNGGFETLQLNHFKDLKVSQNDVQTGTSASIGPRGEAKTAELNRLVGATFDTTALLANTWTSSMANGGTTASANGELTVSTNTTANGSASIQSVKIARFIIGTSNIYASSIRLSDVGGVDNIREWGAFDANNASGNGIYWRLNGTAWELATRKAGVVTTIPESSFNGPNPIVKDTNNHFYEIVYAENEATFFQDRKFIHREIFSSVIPFASMHLKTGLRSVNSGGSIVQHQLFSRGATISRLGTVSTRGIYQRIIGAATTVLKDSPGKLHRMMLNGGGGTSITIYDNTAGSGTIISLINPIASGVGHFDFDLDFDAGLTVVTLGAGIDVTFVWE